MLFPCRKTVWKVHRTKIFQKKHKPLKPPPKAAKIQRTPPPFFHQPLPQPHNIGTCHPKHYPDFQYTQVGLSNQSPLEHWPTFKKSRRTKLLFKNTKLATKIPKTCWRFQVRVGGSVFPVVIFRFIFMLSSVFQIFRQKLSNVFQWSCCWQP